MARKAFSAAWWFSLALCLATMGLWIASHYVYVGVRVVEPNRRDDLRWRSWFVCDGWMGAMSTAFNAGGSENAISSGSTSQIHLDISAQPYQMIVVLTDDADSGRTATALGGLVAMSYGASYSATMFLIWPVVAFFALMPLIRLLASMPRQRTAPGHCPICGYDLRATPDRCPECGHVIAKPTG